MQQLKQGFTFIEFTLSIFFVALLSLTIALVISNITNIYNKGLSIKSVNATGSDLIEEFSAGIISSPATELAAICTGVYNYNTTAYTNCMNDTAYKFIFNEHTANVRNVDSTTSQSLQIAGAFCTGKYSYVWNTGYVDNSLYQDSAGNSIAPTQLTYNLSNGTGGYTTKTINSAFRLLRVEDPSRVACASQLNGYGDNRVTNTYTLTPRAYDLTHDANGGTYIIASDPIELIHADSNTGLAIYELYIARPSQDSTTNRLFYSGSFTLATLRGGVDLTATGDFCRLEGSSEDINYCAINKFNFAAQATGK